MRKVMVLLLTSVLFAACSDVEDEFSSDHQCYFVFDNSVHLDATLMSALNSMSPGIFCQITEGAKGNSIYFFFKSNQGLESEKKANAIDLKRTRKLGIYNPSGVIVGYGNLNNPATLYAFDSQCTNCYESTHMPKYTLTMSNNGIATCASCKRTYDLNNGGIIRSGKEGKKLIRYRASSTGPQGVLSVTN